MKFDFDHFLSSPQPYNKAVDVELVANGISKALTNANELLSDAKLLLNNGRFARSVSLSILAIEERGKVELLKALLLWDVGKIASGWREANSHKKKNFMWGYPLLKMLDVREKEVVERLTGPGSDLSEYLDRTKQLGFYVDAIVSNSGKPHWLLPSEYFTPEAAQLFYGVADSVITDEGIDWTPDALRVFVKHATLVDKEAKMKDLVPFYTDLKDKNLISEERLINILAEIFLSEHPEIIIPKRNNADSAEDEE